MQNTHEGMLQSEGISLANFTAAFRETYQEIFAQHRMELTLETSQVLPVMTIKTISSKLSKKSNNNVLIRTVSDRPRNPLNVANADEKKMLAYFRTHPHEEDKSVRRGDAYYYYRPLRITKSCLKCHGRREDAPTYIRNNYTQAYGYKEGEIRGLISVRIAEQSVGNSAWRHFTWIAVLTFGLYAGVMVMIYFLLRRMHTLERRYADQLEEEVNVQLAKIKDQAKTLQYQAYHDALTGLPNRKYFLQQMEHAVAKLDDEGSKLAVVFIDVDNFKKINDTLGHQVGDSVLRTIARRLERVVRSDDMLARLGGDEFVIMLRCQHRNICVQRLMEDLHRMFESEVLAQGHLLHVTSSIGVSFGPDDARSVEELLKYADAAMYKAKADGRNAYRLYSPEITHGLMERIALEEQLRHASHNQEFVLYYQPQIDARNQEVTGIEALIRWQHPERGFVPPDLFISLAEEIGLIVEIDRWVLSQALEDMRTWYDAGLHPGILSLNLAVKQLLSDQFADLLLAKMAELNFAPEWLELEITEGEMMVDPQTAIDRLDFLRQQGISIALDDFGTGYSSLSYLKSLPINRLKIDKTFVDGIAENKNDAKIIRAIIALAESLGLETIAEGVESRQQVDKLIEQGCYYIQGYYFARPMPASEVAQWLKKHQKI